MEATACWFEPLPYGRGAVVLGPTNVPQPTEQRATPPSAHRFWPMLGEGFEKRDSGGHGVTVHGDLIIGERPGAFDAGFGFYVDSFEQPVGGCLTEVA